MPGTRVLQIFSDFWIFAHIEQGILGMGPIPTHEIHFCFHILLIHTTRRWFYSVFLVHLHFDWPITRGQMRNCPLVTSCQCSKTYSLEHSRFGDFWIGVASLVLTHSACVILGMWVSLERLQGGRMSCSNQWKKENGGWTFTPSSLLRPYAPYKDIIASHSVSASTSLKMLGNSYHVLWCSISWKSKTRGKT